VLMCFVALFGLSTKQVSATPLGTRRPLCCELRESKALECVSQTCLQLIYASPEKVNFAKLGLNCTFIKVEVKSFAEKITKFSANKQKWQTRILYDLHRLNLEIGDQN
jgi:hypothetical protein